MLVSNQFRGLSFSFALFMTFCAAGVQSSENLGEVPCALVYQQEIQENPNLLKTLKQKRSLSFKNHDKAVSLQSPKKRKMHPLKLTDFAGSWIGTENSVGGLNEGVGTAFTLNIQFDLDKQGHGSINYFAQTMYSGGDAEPRHRVSIKPSATLLIEIIDPIVGIGKVSGVMPDHSLRSSLFIVTRSSITGKVVKMQGISDDSSFLTSNIRMFTVTRQYVDDTVIN